jgi:hypothetical protein
MEIKQLFCKVHRYFQRGIFQRGGAAWNEVKGGFQLRIRKSAIVFYIECDYVESALYRLVFSWAFCQYLGLPWIPIDSLLINFFYCFLPYEFADIWPLHLVYSPLWKHKFVWKKIEERWILTNHRNSRLTKTSSESPDYNKTIYPTYTECQIKIYTFSMGQNNLATNTSALHRKKMQSGKCQKK